MEHVKKINSEIIDSSFVSTLKKFIKYDAYFDIDEILKKNWVCRITDSNEIFDEDAVALAQAMRSVGCENFFVMPIAFIIDSASHSIAEAYLFDSTEDGIIEFQRIGWEFLHFDTCLIFDKEISFLIIRTGSSGHVIYSGSQKFIDIACSANNWWWPYPPVPNKTDNV
ncbi:hypothetical protein [Hydromonas duriensis]|uniref:Uncharacterized protein n=1 Tax=Hydromonas duriensis TaxID=1527608 RepID=A0A4V6PY23_9BURK|nr:hypothetical protein [Hydromonas duriensis]TDR28911.1 hypothetical protein DFR44_13111 [Hydromonas duriensis]